MSAACELLREMAPTLSVGALSADLMHLERDLAALEAAGVGVLHVDVMDGVFCPMTTVGPPYVNGLRTSMLKDVHLMVDEPIAKLDDYVAAGADIVTVHAESTIHVHRALQYLGGCENRNDPARGIVRGVALNPGTPIETLAPLAGEVEMVVLLGINPGWGGQGLIESTFRRIREARGVIDGAGRGILLCVDGGITGANLARVADTGVDLIVTGSAVFKGGTPERTAREMLAQLRRK